MKKILILLFGSLLVLGACGNSDSSNEDDSDKKSETKSNDPNKDKSKDKDKKKEDKEKSSNEESQSSQEQSQQTNTQEQQQTQQAATQEQQTQQNNEYDSTKHSDEYNVSHPVSTDDNWTPEMVKENQRLNEEMEANAKVAKENGYTGIPNGDIGGVPTSDKAYSNDQLDPETGLPYDDAVPEDVN